MEFSFGLWVLLGLKKKKKPDFMVSKNSSVLTVKSVFFSEEGNTFHSQGHLSENFSCPTPSRNLETITHSGAQLTLGIGSRCSCVYFTQCVCCLGVCHPTIFPKTVCPGTEILGLYGTEKRSLGWRGCGVVFHMHACSSAASKLQIPLWEGWYVDLLRGFWDPNPPSEAVISGLTFLSGVYQPT